LYSNRDEEKRKMCHSISIKNLHQSSTISTNNDEEQQLQDVISSLLDKIDKEINSSNDSCHVLFNASNNYRRKSSDTQLLDNENLFHSLDDYKHSIGILVDDKDIASRKYYILVFFHHFIKILT